MPDRRPWITPIYLAALVVACGGGDSAGSSGSTTPVSEQYTVEVTPESPSLLVGSKSQLSATVRNSAGTVVLMAVQWSSSNAVVATVDAHGVVTARGAGTATVIATTANASGSATVTVTAPVTLRGMGTIYASGRRIPIPGGPQTLDIVAYNAQTGAEKDITPSPMDELLPAVSPDGQYLVYWQIASGFDLGGSLGKLMLAKTDGTLVLDVGATVITGCFLVCPEQRQWLADGHLEYLFDGFPEQSIRLVIPRSTPQSIAWPTALASLADGLATNVLLAPAGNLAVTVATSGALVDVRFSDGGSTSIAPACTFPSTCGAYAWAPSGTSLYAARDGAIVNVAIDGSAIHTLYTATAGGLTETAASPDGSMLAFVEAGSLKILRLSDNSVTAIASTRGQLAWSPDSKSVAFAIGGVGSSPGSQVGAINSDGTGAKVFSDLGVVRGISWGK